MRRVSDLRSIRESTVGRREEEECNICIIGYAKNYDQDIKVISNKTNTSERFILKDC